LALTQAHGGTLHLNSPSGQGTTVVLRLPLMEGNQT
jgi:signal transduction histidine kinase